MNTTGSTANAIPDRTRCIRVRPSTGFLLGIRKQPIPKPPGTRGAALSTLIRDKELVSGLVFKHCTDILGRIPRHHPAKMHIDNDISGGESRIFDVHFRHKATETVFALSK